MTKKIFKNPNSNNYFNKPEENCSSRGRGKTWRCCPNQQDKLKKHKNPETAWTNKEWIFHHEINSDELHKPKIPLGEKVSLLTVEQLRTKYKKKAATSSNFRKVLWWTLTRTDFSIMYSWFVIRYYSLLTTGRCYKAIVCCKAKMCSHEILKICMCLEVAFPWKPRTRQSFRETRFKNEIFWTISGLKRLVESFNVHLKNIDELPLLLVLLSLWPCGSGKLCNCKLYV